MRLICGVLPIKVDLHPLGTPKPPKNTFLLQQDHVFGGFGVPGGCKSTLIGKSPHINLTHTLNYAKMSYVVVVRRRPADLNGFSCSNKIDNMKMCKIETELKLI